jgi:hypothetical protein
MTITNFQTLTGRAPVFLDAEVGLIADDIIVLRYGKSPDPASEPATTDFAVAGTSETITTVTFIGNTVRLTMSSDLLSSDTLTVSYTAGSNPLRDTSINESVDLVTESVTNNITP